MPQERRDLGLVYLRLGEPTKALPVLEPYLSVCGSEQAAALAALAASRAADDRRTELAGRHERSRHGCSRLTLPSRADPTSPIASPHVTGHVDWTGRRVTVMGLGRHGGGVAAARYLASAGRTSRSATRPIATTLADSLGAAARRADRGGPSGRPRRSRFRDAEFVVVNPAVRPDHPCLQLARTARRDCRPPRSSCFCELVRPR